MKRYQVFTLLVLGVLLMPALSLAVNWWDTNYRYRRQITINNISGSNLESGYSVMATLNTTDGTRFLANGNDLRVVYWNGSANIELNREVIDMATTNTKVWFPTQVLIGVGNLDSNYYFYYGYPAAGGAPSDRNKVYLFFDDFNDGNDDGWGTEAGNWQVINGEYIGAYNGTADKPFSSAGDSSWKDYVVQVKVKAVGQNSSEIAARVQGATTNTHYLYAQDWNKPNTFECKIFKRENGAYVKKGTTTYDKSNTYQMLKFAVTGNSLKGKSWKTGTNEPANWMLAGADASFTKGKFALTQYRGTVHYDDVLVRKYLEPEPTTSISLEVEDEDTPPTSVITFPLEGSTINSLVHVQGTAADTGFGVALVEVDIRRGSDGLFWNGAAWGAAQIWLPAIGTTSWIYLWPPSLMSNTYTVRSRATDKAGNVEISGPGVTFTLLIPDNQPPVSNITYPPNGAILTSPAWTIEGTASDNNSGVDQVKVSISRVSDGAYWNEASWGATQTWLTATGTTSWTYPWPAAIIMKGIYNIQSRATDKAANVETPGPGVTVTLSIPDNLPPVSTITNPNHGDVLPNLTQVKGTATDENSGVVLVKISIKRLSDNKYWNGAWWVAGQTWLTVIGTTAWTYPWPPGIGDGSYQLHSKATDGGGNIEVPNGSVIFTISFTDTLPPVSTITDPANGATLNSLAQIKGTATDDNSGVVLVGVNIKRNSDNKYWNGAWWATGQVWLTATGTTSWTYPWPPGTGGGSYTIQSRATDGVGHQETPGPGVTFTLIDNQPPTSAITNPTDGAILSSLVQIEGTASDVKPGVVLVKVSIRRHSDNVYWNGAWWVTTPTWLTAIGTNNWTYPWLAGGGNDLYTICSKATDGHGNVETPGPGVTFTLTTDTQPPSSSITNPTQGAILTSLAQIKGTAADNSGVAQVKVTIRRSSDSLYWNGAAWGATQNWLLATGTTSWTYPWPAVGTNTYTLQSRATDTDGNVEIPTSSVTFTLSSVPVPPLKVVFNSPQRAGSEFEVNIQVGEAGTPAANLFGLSFHLNYSPSDQISEVINIEPGGFLGGNTTMYNEETAGKIIIGISQKRPGSGVNGFGNVVKIRFRISSYAAAGSTINFTLSAIDTRDLNWNEILLSPVPAQLTISDFAVWPGDTNNDGVVNEIDILPLGSFWHRTGPPRTGANPANWEAQLATIWSPEPAATYADANGDGVINEKEVVIIGMHWGQTHTGSPAPSREIWTSSGNLAAYQAMYRFLEDSPESEPITKIRELLSSLIEKATKGQIPIKTDLAQNYPNPINPETWIPFTLASSSPVKILIYNIGGELVRSLDLGNRSPGSYLTRKEAAYWDGKDNEGREVPSGVYLYQLWAGQETMITKRMMVIK